MTKNHPIGTRDYLPAAGSDRRLRLYDPMSTVFRIGRVHRRLLADAASAPGMDVLEIGCGTGNLLRSVLRGEPMVRAVGIDPDPLALRIARRKVPGARLDEGYAQRLPYGDDSFDRVLSAFMFHHLSPEVQREVAAEVRRALRPGGSVHIVDVMGHRHGAEEGATFAVDEYAVPRVFDTAGVDLGVVRTARMWPFGRIAYYRG
ncbi:class I SAM-dependent methyltransferase [Tsukamurella sp. 8F]|uniref:class I SAM-dependent methyltransferase n=1 Tax=unclassified Tsukamurella TaxID=2633480 RepID=UPI0023B9AB23|nr:MULTISPECIES: class I SAM-dependent methyltransferase [unclassified Tsukamurella]MDF0528354.1 class I SAM-dependent methyltransferase [Tsukamurella sp. 8J]MDF0586179.1 class I SAM-dependent methyltransferase [Tsukamurella sp. 8F]